MGIKEEIRALIVPNPNIQLRPGEFCVFYVKGQYGTSHLQTTTKVKPGVGLGVVVPVSKHFGIGVGKRKVKTETSTQTVWDKQSCEFYLLDNRIVIKFKKGIYDIAIGSITNTQVYKDAIEIHCGSQKHMLFMSKSEIKRFIHLFDLLGQAQQMGINLDDLGSTVTTGYTYAQAPVQAPIQQAPATQPYSVSYGGAQITSNRTATNDYARTIFLWAVGRKPTPIKKRDEYPRYLFDDCNIQNAPKFHKEMIEQGYLATPSPADTLSSFKVTELKEILKENGLPSTGKKDALVQSILENVPNEKLVRLVPSNQYVLSEFGKQYVDAHDDYIKLHNHRAWDISAAEYDAEKAATPNMRFNDICWRIFNRRITQTQEIREHRNIYYNMFLLTKEEGKNKTALDMLLRVLYIDVSGATNSYVDLVKRGWMTKQDFSKEVESSIFFAPSMIKDIGNLEEEFSNDMLERICTWRLPINLCPNNLYADIVFSIFRGDFDEVKYKHYLAMEYQRRI